MSLIEEMLKNKELIKRNGLIYEKYVLQHQVHPHPINSESIRKCHKFVTIFDSFAENIFFNAFGDPWQIGQHPYYKIVKRCLLCGQTKTKFAYNSGI